MDSIGPCLNMHQKCVNSEIVPLSCISYFILDNFILRHMKSDVFRVNMKIFHSIFIYVSAYCLFFDGVALEAVFHDCNPKPLCLEVMQGNTSQTISDPSNGYQPVVSPNIGGFGSSLSANPTVGSSAFPPPTSQSAINKSYTLGSSTSSFSGVDFMSQSLAFIIQPLLSNYKNMALGVDMVSNPSGDWPLVLGTLNTGSNAVTSSQVFISTGSTLTLADYPNRILTNSGNTVVASSIYRDSIVRLSASSDSTYYNIFINTRQSSNSIYDYAGAVCVNKSTGKIYINTSSLSTECKWAVKTING